MGRQCRTAAFLSGQIIMTASLARQREKNRFLKKSSRLASVIEAYAFGVAVLTRGGVPSSLKRFLYHGQ